MRSERKCEGAWVDTDGDGLFTFYDGSSSRNEFIDDFFGWNFRTGAWVVSTRLNESVGIVNVFRQSGAALRNTSPNLWQNPVNHFGAHGDGILTPLDVLAMMNYIIRSSR